MFTSLAGDTVNALLGWALIYGHAGLPALGVRISIILRGALRGAKDVRVPALIGVAVIWTCVPSAAFLLGRLAGWGSAGGWIGFIAETALGSVLFARRWRRGAWRLAYLK